MSSDLLPHHSIADIETIAQVIINYRLQTLRYIRHDLANIVAVIEFDEYDTNESKQSTTSLRKFLTKLDSGILYYSNFNIEQNTKNFIKLCHVNSIQEIVGQTLILNKNRYDSEIILGLNLKTILENIDHFEEKIIVDIDILQTILQMINYNLQVNETTSSVEFTLNPV